MKTILRLYFNPADHIFPEDYRGADFFDIVDPVYIPTNGTKVYFDAANYISDPTVSNRIIELMDREGLLLSIWRVQYDTNETIICGSLSSIEYWSRE